MNKIRGKKVFKFIKYIIVVVVFTPILSNAQHTIISFTGKKVQTENITPICINEDNEALGFSQDFEINGAMVTEQWINNILYQRVHIRNFNYLQEVGKPALPARTTLVAIPLNAKASIKINNFQSIEYEGYNIYPAGIPQTDNKNKLSSKFIIDSGCYKTNAFYPTSPVEIIEILQFREMSIAVVRICPVQFNPVTKKIKTYSKIQYTIEFTNGSSSFICPSNYTTEVLQMLPNMVQNNIAINNEVNEVLHNNADNKLKNKGDAKDYIIITHSNYLTAAQTFAKWKQQLGYSVEIVSGSTWTSATVKSAIQSRYQAWTPKPSYFVIIGDHDLVPGEIVLSPQDGSAFASDNYYACMNGIDDYVPDMARGRISVKSAMQANYVIQKIINYEKNPVNDSVFYKNILAAAEFQDNDPFPNTYEDRRFTLTIEEIKTYLESKSFTVHRAYACNDTSANPLYYNHGEYAIGEPLPDYLKKPTFRWNAGPSTVSSIINNGVFLAMHRGHGYDDASGWGFPDYRSTAAASVGNLNRHPIVFSIECNSGEFQQPECFAEAFLRNQYGGTVGIISAAFPSLSGYNDALIIGLVDAIWPSFIPVFTGYGGIKNPVVVAHTPIYQVGYILNQGLFRMVETWGGQTKYNKYQYNLFHLFGDPSLRIHTQYPTNITALHVPCINSNQTSLSINNCNVSGALVTLLVNDTLIAKQQLTGNSGTITFPLLSYTSNIILTISKHNCKPYIANLCFSTDVNFISQNNNFTIYPNPASNRLFIEFEMARTNQTIVLSIFNILGNKVYDELINTNQSSFTHCINTENLSAGVYLFALSTNEGIIVRKVVIE